MAKAKPYTAYDGYRDFKWLYDTYQKYRGYINRAGTKRGRAYTIPAAPIRQAKMPRRESGAFKRLQREVQRAPKWRAPPKRRVQRFKRRVTAVYNRNKYHSVGRMGSRFRRPRKFRASKYQLNGAVVHIEAGGVVNSGVTQVMYVGHSLPMYEAFRCVCYYLVKLMWRKHGRAITSFYDMIQEANITHPNSPGDVTYRYQVTEGGPVANGTFNIPANSTFFDVVVLLEGALRSLIGGGTAYVELLSIIYIPDLFDVGLNMQIDLTNLMLDLDCTGKLALQNRTLAGTGVGDESSMLDIANNPIGGKVYCGKGPGPQPKWRNNVGVADCVSPFCDQTTGMIDWDVDQVNFTTEMTNQYSRPPPASAFQFCSSSQGVFLKPGEIKNSIVTVKKKYWFNNFVRMYIQQATVGPTVTVGSGFGNFKMYGFEKKVNTTVEEPVISVGYEHNMTFRCKGTFRKRITIPIQLTA